MSEHANVQRRLYMVLTLGVVLSLALGRATFAAEQNESPYIGPAAAFKDKQTLDEKLKTNVDVHLVETPLKDVAALLQETIGTTVILSAKRLDEAAVSLDTPITAKFKGLKLRTALKLILEDLELTYAEREQYLQITTPDDAESQPITRVYDVRELLALKDPFGRDQGVQWSTPTNKSPPAAETPAVATPVPPGILPQFGGRGLGAPPAANSFDLMADDLVDIITSEVASQTWSTSNDGPSEYMGLLVISQTTQVHEQIEHLLNMLHEAAGLTSKTVRVIR